MSHHRPGSLLKNLRFSSVLVKVLIPKDLRKLEKNLATKKHMEILNQQTISREQLLKIKSANYCYSYLYSRLRDGNGCAARTKEPECLMPSKYHTKFNIISKERYTNIPK